MIPASIEPSRSIRAHRADPSRAGRQGQAEAQWRKGVKASEAGQWADARRHFERAARLAPDEAVFWLNLAQACRKLKDSPGAQQAARHALDLDSENLLACKLLATVHAEQGRRAEAIEVLRSLPETVVRDHDFHLVLAQILRSHGEYRDAESAARRAWQLDPFSLTACCLLAAILAEQRRHAEAVEVFAALPASVKRDHEYHCAYGESLYWDRRYTDATEQFILSFTCKPDHAPAHMRLANAFTKLGMYEEAAECYRTVTLLQPWDAQAMGSLIHQNQQACRWDTLAEDTRKIANLIAEKDPPATRPFGYLMLESTPAQQLRVAQISAKFEFGNIARMPALEREPRSDGERLRIAYVSSDFQYHATAMLMAEVLERHDRDRFEIFLYSCAPDDSTELRRRVMASSEHWVDASELSDEDLARRIRADGIDIAVDLKGYTNDTRLHAFARRPAPIQVTWLGYPGTTGTDFIDYIIGDPIVTPAVAQPFFSERIAQMPWSYQPNDRKRPLGSAPSRASMGLPEDAFVFCCFNNNYKITPQVYDVWCRLLKAVPASVLWLFEANPQASENLLREAAARGIPRGRIVFAPFLRQEAHIARLGAADLFLDTLPCNAHTTASDALWAGVPLVTCMGDSFVGRVAASLLRAVGCDELITRTLDDYEALALSLAREPERLRAIRAGLNERRHEVPLFDSARFARDIEALYGRMAQRWRAGLAPESLWSM
jgi:predicted O-linked N-acetylglucosamine transferase (SPINDLY family)